MILASVTVPGYHDSNVQVLWVPTGDQAVMPLAQALLEITLVAIWGSTSADDIPELNLKVGNRMK